MKLFYFANGLTAALLIIIVGGFVGCSEEEAGAIIRITEPSSGSSTDKGAVLLAGEVENNTSDQVQIFVNGSTEHTANISDGQFSAIITLDEGGNLIEVLVDEAEAQVGITRTKHIPVADIIDMVLIPEGEFEMGDHHGDGWEQELPVHTVYLDVFYIDKYEVTNAQYARFLNEYGRDTDAEEHSFLHIDDPWCKIENVGGVYKPEIGHENHPLAEVSWYGAAAYAQFYGKRLPTEAQWEKAARGGLVGKKYPWGNDISQDEANYYGTDGNDVWENTAPVGSFAPNGYELHDMAGNVWEWCADEYDDNYYNISPKNNPTGPGVAVTFKNDDFTKVNPERVIHGGSWYGNWRSLRVSNRSYYAPTTTGRFVGFRCVFQD